jgi:hypothetical protein
MNKKKKNILCMIGWHTPSEKVEFNGCSLGSICKRCRCNILQDSQGNWFKIKKGVL